MKQSVQTDRRTREGGICKSSLGMLFSVFLRSLLLVAAPGVYSDWSEASVIQNVF
jgi:hypothetical protein